MRGHITSQELHLVSDGAIQPESLPEISRHLDACPLCARRAEELVDIRALAATLRDTLGVDEHPEMSDLTSYVDDELDPTAREWIDTHLEWCARCGEDITDLRAEQQTLRDGWHAWQWIAAGIFMAGAIGAGMMWLQNRSTVPALPPRARVHVVPPIVPHVAPTPRSDAWIELEQSVLAAGRIDPPAILRTLRPATQTLRGSETVTQTRLSPAGEVVADDRPVLSWTATPDAKYVVMIFASEEPVATSPALTDTHWTPPQPLQRGATYSWQVETRGANGSSTIAPAPPQPEALFRIVDATTLADIDAARRAHPDDQLLLGILYGRAGMRSRALAEPESHLASHPADARAGILADGVRRW